MLFSLKTKHITGYKKQICDKEKESQFSEKN